MKKITVELNDVDYIEIQAVCNVLKKHGKNISIEKMIKSCIEVNFNSQTWLDYEDTNDKIYKEWEKEIDKLTQLTTIKNTPKIYYIGVCPVCGRNYTQQRLTDKAKNSYCGCAGNVNKLLVNWTKK